jgi:hypothetical protein
MGIAKKVNDSKAPRIFSGCFVFLGEDQHIISCTSAISEIFKKNITIKNMATWDHRWVAIGSLSDGQRPSEILDWS